MKYLLIIYLVVLTLLSFLFCHLIYEKKMKNDLFFFVISNFILSFSFLVFFFYYEDYLFSLVNMFFLLLNTIFLSFEIKMTYDKYKVLSIPYLIYIVFIFYIIIDLYLMNRWTLEIRVVAVLRSAFLFWL